MDLFGAKRKREHGRDHQKPQHPHRHKYNLPFLRTKRFNICVTGAVSGLTAEKESRMKLRASDLVFIGLWAGAGVWAASAPYPATPKAVVEEYLRLDAEAAGLSPSTWPELGRLTNYPQAPKWDSFTVIDRYEIEKTLEGHTRAQIRVTYHPLGQLSDHFTPDTKPEHVVFYVNLAQGQWKVDSLSGMPHVSFNVMKKRLNASSAANPKMKKANDVLLQQIESARATLK
jgi:hypothetical protein